MCILKIIRLFKHLENMLLQLYLYIYIYIYIYNYNIYYSIIIFIISLISITNTIHFLMLFITYVT